jgi:GNAT superfamily N-acetyltransferase
MITYTAANSENDLVGILKLQKANLAESLDPEEMRQEGFVTVNHTFDQLKKLNDDEKHIIGEDEERIIGYVLAMTEKSKEEIPVLIPMFRKFDAVIYHGKNISNYRYLVVGQVCVDRQYRGQGVFDQCYNLYKKRYAVKYDFAITEIAVANSRSLKAHQRIGFNPIHSYSKSDKTEWIIVVWDWKESH